MKWRRNSSYEALEHRQMLSVNSLVVSELMYNPTVDDAERAAGLKDRDFEFIEIFNSGEDAVDLGGVTLSDAVDVVFDQITLEPGQRAVAVHNRSAFETRYGRALLIAGQYDGTFGNGKDRVVLKDASGAVLEDFEYDDAWYPTTDGGGVSLTAVEPSNTSANRNLASSWKPSSLAGGSAGYGDGIDDPRPKGLVADVISSRHVALEWTPPSHVDSGNLGYRVYRDGQLLGSTAETSFTDATGVPGGKYSYQIAIVHGDRAESTSSPLSVSIESVGGDVTFAAGVSRGTVQTGLNEMSGLVASRTNKGVLWTHSDGPQTKVHAISTSGEELGTVELTGIATRDWEDIAIGPGPANGVQYVYVANTGAKPKLNVVQVFRFSEPAVAADTPFGSMSATDVVTISLQYPSGDEFNTETLLSDPRTGDLFLIVKQGTIPKIYRAPAADLASDSVVQLEVVGEVGLPSVSGGDISPTGNEILIRNEDIALLFTREDGQTIAEAFQSDPVLVPVVGRPTEPNGEAITFDSTGRNYFTVSEGIAPPLYSFERIPPSLAGDANRDGLFNSSDLVLVFQAAKYDSEQPTTWEEGDWNGDGFFNSRDLVAAFQLGRFEKPAPAVVDSIFDNTFKPTKHARRIVLDWFDRDIKTEDGTSV